MADPGKKTRPPQARPSDPPLATLRVGIALGTYRTSVVASNGAREHFGSLVGWPRSAAARKLLGLDVLVGAEAFRYRVAVELARPYEGGVVPESAGEAPLRAVADLVRRAVKLARAAPGERISGVLAVPAKAARSSRDALVKAASESMTVTEVIPEAWAAGKAAGAPEGSLVVDVGAGNTVVCRVTADPPTERDLVILPSGGDGIDLDLMKRLQEKLPGGEFTVAGVRELKERYGCLVDTDSALVGLPVAGRTAPVDVAPQMAAACRAQVPAILDAIRSLLPSSPAGGETTVLLAGCGGQMKGLELLITEGLKGMGGGRVLKAVDPLFAGADGALARTVPRDR